MVQIITTILLAFTLISFGQITQALKKLVGMITKNLLKLINAFGIKIETKEIILYTIKIRFVNELDMFKPQEISIESYNDYNIIESINNYKL